MRAAIALLALSGCISAEPPSLVVDSHDPALQSRRGLLTYAGRAFSGSVIDDSDARYGQRIPYQRGLRHGLAQAFYPDGQVAYRRLYLHGLREGGHVGFWPGGQVQFVYRYLHDVFDGEQVGYYKNGVRSELRHYRAGQEEGRQQIWDGQARLTTNYTVKEGRRYGLVGRFDCVTVH